MTNYSENIAKSILNLFELLCTLQYHMPWIPWIHTVLVPVHHHCSTFYGWATGTDQSTSKLKQRHSVAPKRRVNTDNIWPCECDESKCISRTLLLLHKTYGWMYVPDFFLRQIALKMEQQHCVTARHLILWTQHLINLFQTSQTHHMGEDLDTSAAQAWGVRE